MRLLKHIAGFVLVLLFSGCASLIHGPTQMVVITSQPTGANVSVNGRHVGTTPYVTELRRSGVKTESGFADHVIGITREGYMPFMTEIDRRFDGWFLGNILLGGLIGMAIDAANGSMYVLDPSGINGRLMISDTAYVRSIYNNVEDQPESYKRIVIEHSYFTKMKDGVKVVSSDGQEFMLKREENLDILVEPSPTPMTFDFYHNEVQVHTLKVPIDEPITVLYEFNGKKNGTINIDETIGNRKEVVLNEISPAWTSYGASYVNTPNMYKPVVEDREAYKRIVIEHSYFTKMKDGVKVVSSDGQEFVLQREQYLDILVERGANPMIFDFYRDGIHLYSLEVPIDDNGTALYEFNGKSNGTISIDEALGTKKEDVLNVLAPNNRVGN